MKRTHVIIAIWTGLLSATAQATFVHPGCLSTSDDLIRMATKVAASAQPWKGSWDVLVANSHASLSYTPQPQPIIYVGGGTSENYIKLANDAAAAYQCALRYHGSGNADYADKSVQILNAWANTHTNWMGDSNVDLRAGIYGYQMACAAELIRDYSGWNTSDFNAFKNYMLNVFYPENSDFLVRLNGTYDMHYWANWTLSSVASMMAIGVLCDDQAIFDEALDAVYNHRGTAKMAHAVPFVHPNGLGQWQESGRDQGHTLMGPQLLGTICEIAWNQGIDLYGYLDNRFLASVEYISKYNTANDVPFVTYIRKYGNMASGAVYDIMNSISPDGRGAIRPGWDLVYNHYVNRMGMAAPYTAQYAELARPEGGGGNYGATSGGFDGLGFTTLTHTRDPIASGAVPGNLIPYVKGRQITLSWAGSAYAQSYNVKRSTTPGGPYATLAAVGTDNLYYVDSGLTAGTTYYYTVSANNPDGVSSNSAEVGATADGQLHGTIIGTDGSWNDAGADKHCVFDGSLDNYFDGPASVSWAGLDLGAGASAVITQVKYSPRASIPSRMVGGRFQGSNTPDFSSGVVDLYTIASTPATDVLTTQTISNTNAFRYVRYLSPSGGYGNVAEVQFLGNVSGLAVPAAPSAPSLSVILSQVDLSWSAVAGAASYNVKRSTASGGPFVIIGNVTGTAFSDSSATAGPNYYVISALNPLGESADSEPAHASISAKLTGSVIGTTGSWENNPATTREAALDGDLDTAFDYSQASGGWVGLDLGEACTISRIRYAPRDELASRMVGGLFQGSNNGSAWTTLYTVGTQPAEGAYTEQPIANTNTFRYARYYGPTGGYCNVAEIEFHGVSHAVPEVPPGLSAESTDRQVSLFWNAVANATGYHVKSALASGGPYNTLIHTASTDYMDQNLTNGTVYYYVVSAVGPVAEGADSTETSAVPSPSVGPEEYLFADHAITGGTNLSMTLSNTVSGHLYQLLGTDTLVSPNWLPAGSAEAGNSSNILLNIPITGIPSNRFFKLDVQRQ